MATPHNMNNDTPKTIAAWSAAREQTDTNNSPDWCCVAHDMRDKCAELERENAWLLQEMKTAHELISARRTIDAEQHLRALLSPLPNDATDQP